jgi:hypothetical protein
VVVLHNTLSVLYSLISIQFFNYSTSFLHLLVYLLAGLLNLLAGFRTLLLDELASFFNLLAGRSFCSSICWRCFSLAGVASVLLGVAVPSSRVVCTALRFVGDSHR